MKSLTLDKTQNGVNSTQIGSFNWVLQICQRLLSAMPYSLKRNNACWVYSIVYEQIDLAFIYGSIAKREDTASSDIDLLVVTDSLAYPVLAQWIKRYGEPAREIIKLHGQYSNELDSLN